MASDGGGSNKAQKMDHESGGGGSGSAQRTLTDVFLKEKGLFYILVPFTSVPHASRLMITCKELYTAEEVVLQKLPKVCDMTSGHGLMMFRLMVGVPNSRWLEWLDTSGVEELKLPQSVTDEEMLIMFSGERFSKLRTLNLFLKGGGRNITVTPV